MDKIVQLYESEAARHVAQVQIIQLIFLAAAAVLVAVTLFITERHLLTPIARLGEAARRIGTGNLEAPVSVSGLGEVDWLAHSFDEMRRSLVTSTEAQAALLELSRRLLAARDEHAVAECAVEIAASALHADFSALVLPDTEGRLLTQAVCGWPADFAGRFELGRGNASQTGYTIQHGYPVAIEDYATEMAFTVSPVVFEQSIVSGLSAPMILAGRVVGAMLVHSRTRRQFADGDIQLLSLIANQTAVALEKSWLFEAEQRRREAATALLEITQVVGSSLELNQVLKQIAQRTAFACQANRCTIFLLDDAGKVLQPMMSQFADGHTDFAQWKDFKATTADQVDAVPLFRAAVRERRPALLDDAARTDLVPSRWTQPFGIQKMLAVPLVSHDRVIGLMALDHTDASHQFTSEQIDLALTIGGQVTGAITNARLYAEAERRAGQLHILHEASRSLSSDLHLDAMLHTLAETARRLTSARYAALAVLDAEGTSVAQFHTAGLTEAERQKIGAPPQGRGLLGSILRSSAPIRVADLTCDPRAAGFPPGHPNMKTLLGVPIVAKGQVIGSLYLTDKEGGGPFTQEDENMMMRLTADIAIALTNAQLFEQVHQLSITDELTGLYNRRHFFALAEREFERARRYGRPLSTILLDVDHFKQVNDTYGHAVGDQVLRAVARRCRAALREIDVLGRYGGEEFVAILPESELGSARQTANRLRHSIADAPVDTDHVPLKITISLGVACLREDCLDLATLLNQADAAMYAAKRAGRNCVHLDLQSSS